MHMSQAAATATFALGSEAMPKIVMLVRSCEVLRLYACRNRAHQLVGTYKLKILHGPEATEEKAAVLAPLRHVDSISVRKHLSVHAVRPACMYAEGQLHCLCLIYDWHQA